MLVLPVDKTEDLDMCTPDNVAVDTMAVRLAVQSFFLHNQGMLDVLENREVLEIVIPATVPMVFFDALDTDVVTIQDTHIFNASKVWINFHHDGAIHLFPGGMALLYGVEDEHGYRVWVQLGGSQPLTP